MICDCPLVSCWRNDEDSFFPTLMGLSLVLSTFLRNLFLYGKWEGSFSIFSTLQRQLWKLEHLYEGILDSQGSREIVEKWCEERQNEVLFPPTKWRLCWRKRRKTYKLSLTSINLLIKVLAIFSMLKSKESSQSPL